MEAVIFQPANEEEWKLLKQFIESSKIRNKVITDEEKEDLVLGLLMQEVNYSDTVNTQEFLNTLKAGK